MATILSILVLILDVVWFILIVHVIMSWLINFQVLNLRQPLVAQLWFGLSKLLEPIYGRIRRFLPDMGGIDITPIIVLLIVFATRNIIIPDIANALGLAIRR